MNNKGWDVIYAVRTDLVTKDIQANMSKLITEFSFSGKLGDRAYRISGRFRPWSVTNVGSSTMVGVVCPTEGCMIEVTTDGVTARVISGVASHIQVEETEALHVSRIALMVRGYLRSECVKELLSQAQDSSLTHSTLQLRATMSAIRHPCLIMGQCPSNFEGRNRMAR